MEPPGCEYQINMNVGCAYVMDNMNIKNINFLDKQLILLCLHHITSDAKMFATEATKNLC